VWLLRLTLFAVVNKPTMLLLMLRLVAVLITEPVALTAVLW
jgi:hypothetical protein